MKGNDRLRRALRALRPPRHSPPPLTDEWARDISTRIEALERQLKLLNLTAITAIIAEVLTRLLR